MKILMTLMGLDIGGAETHVLELSRALKAMGEDIIVASRGGVYVKELEECGIRHVTLPLHTKNPFSVIKSYFGLRKLIKKEKIDIVHAHARIPAFICGLLHRRLHFRFVCSAHWVFDVNAVWKRISDWGEKTIAVSEDIKQYVIDNYGVFADNISVTINGVDMNKFSADTDCTSVAAELGLPPKRRTIVYVSRMDTDRSAAARMLAIIAPSLKEKYGDLQIVIVGGGNDFEYVNSLAEAANTAAGTKFVHMTGARTDINKLIALGDIFVGVSRAVLEAMSASKPVVIAGNEGYIGLLGEENMDIAVATNFCCRGCEETTEELLRRDLCRLLDLSADEFSEIGEKNRRIIEENYSAARMAKDCKAVYSSLYPYDYKKYGDIVFSGYYGFGNMGDDSLLISIINNLRSLDPNVRITALTRNPKKMCRKYGVKCVGRFNIFAVIREFRHAKLLISGGGSLFQNNTSAKSLEYYIQIIKLAKRMGLPVMIYANGIGPLYGERSHEKVKKVLREVDDISLREPSSYDFLGEIGLEKDVLENIRVTADPALTLSPQTDARKIYIFESACIGDPSECFAVSLREWQNLRTSADASDRSEFIGRMADAISGISETLGKTPVFIPVQRSLDDQICLDVKELVEKRTGKECPFLRGLAAREVIALVRDMSFVIGMRLHMLIYASAAGVPAIGLSYDPKVTAFLKYADQFASFDAAKTDEKELTDAAAELMNHRDSLCEKTEKRASELRALAVYDAEKT
ncbi:MAG: polysaccharide pyruvyl transferase CsaB, partial [Clostridia bacterium]|nr:polysaccharide pyruvyl transferase CsaB [Clostridia bacterium]